MGLLILRYQREMAETYSRRDIFGKIARQILKPPTKIVQLPKRRSNGFSPAHEKRLPPHISFRSAASYHFMSALAFGMFTFWLFGYNTSTFFGVLFCALIFYILIKAICEPWMDNPTNINTSRNFSQASFF